MNSQFNRIHCILFLYIFKNTKTNLAKFYKIIEQLLLTEKLINIIMLLKTILNLSETGGDAYGVH